MNKYIFGRVIELILSMKKIIILLISAFISIQTYAGDIYENIGASIGSGNAKSLAAYFDNNIDLTIISQESMYSRVQAESIVRDFFAKNPAKSFTIIHKGASKEGTLYAIGNFTTTQGKVFRTSFFLKQVGSNYIIQELRFEAQ